MKVIIIGNHAAGISAAETLRNSDKSMDIRMISRENTPPYSRCLIPLLLSGEKKEEEILFRDPDFYESHNITTLFGREVLRVFPKDKTVLLDTGEKLGYDRLVIATGSDPQTMTIPGIRNKGVTTLRTLDDARGIISMMDRVKNVVVLGGGLIGLKAAYGLAKAGKKVTIAVSSPSIMSQIMNERESTVVEQYLAGIGIEVRKNTSPARILGSQNAEAVETTTGAKLPCELVIVGKGVSANRSLVEGSGIATGYGIITDDRCATNASDVFAAGDVAQSHDTVRKAGWMNTLWPHAVEEGRVAASNILGEKVVLRGRTSMNSLVLGDLAIVSCGQTGAREEIEGGEEIVHVQPNTGAYKRFTLKDGRIAGYVLIGDVEHAGVLTVLVTKEIPVQTVTHLLRKGIVSFGSLFPLMREHRDRFTEKEFTEVFSFVTENRKLDTAQTHGNKE
jgi:NAD(P)H-nitrite reductase large subunit